jgi:nitrate reductase assembly molybdenum cofactor insertion protein NarJ
MKGDCGSENLTKLKQPLPEFRSRLFENQEPFHYSFLIIRSSLWQ